MVKKMLGAVLVLAFALSSIAVAQEAPKKEMKKEEKHVYKSVTCDPQCGFMVRSHDEKELTEIVKMHAKKQHNMEMTDKDVQAKMKTEGMEMKKEEKKEMMKEEKKEMMKEEKKN